MKALILYKTGETEPAHSTAVQTAFVSGGGVTSDLYLITTFDQTVVDYATTNNYDAIIYSYSGLGSYLTLANANPDIMIFMPTNSEYASSTASQPQQLVVTDCNADHQGSDEYEFFDDTQALDSYSNGYIAGQLFYIASQRSCSLQEARIRANATKSSSGIIDINHAIMYDGDIKLTVGDISVERGTGLSSTITLGRITDATIYDIETGTRTTTTSLSNSYTLPYYGIHTFRYRGRNSNLTSDWSDIFTLKYNSGQYLKIA